MHVLFICLAIVWSPYSGFFSATLAGFFSQGAVVGLCALLAKFFPAEIRASATGFGIGLGRGGIVAGLIFHLLTAYNPSRL